jgi:D-arabinose 1-dehydrogenase-like Zn-dependent alcohol dehydrogenase
VTDLDRGFGLRKNYTSRSYRNPRQINFLVGPKVRHTDFRSEPSICARLGADEVVISKKEAEMQKHAGTFNFILDAVSADHDLNAYLKLLKQL